VHSLSIHVVQINSINRTAALFSVFAKLLRKRVICRTIGGDIWLLTEYKTNKQYSLKPHLFALKFVDVIISQSTESTKFLIDLGISKVRIVQIPNGVDIHHFSPLPISVRQSLRENLGIRTDDKVACCVNRLHQIKRVDMLISSFAQIVAKFPSAKLLIIGDGKLRQKLHELASTLEVQKHVFFIGAVEDPSKYLQASDLFLLGSDEENQSNALIEAMSCGIPVVATKVGGNKEIVQPGVNGLLVARSSINELSQAISQILQDKELGARLGISARQSVVEKYSFDDVVERYLSLYDLPS